MTPLVLALDIGTSSVRALPFDARGKALDGCLASRTHRVATTPDGGAELDADQLVESAVQCLEESLERLGPDRRRLVGVSLCTFWHSMVGLDKAGRPATPVYLWHDTRCAPDVARLAALLEDAGIDRKDVYLRTGCPPHTSYWPARLLWLARTRPALFARTARWVSPGEYLYLKLFGETACSLSMASGTGLLDQNQGRWDTELLRVLSVPPEALSPLCDLAMADAFTGLRAPYRERLAPLADLPWLPALGDGACSNVGAGATGPGRIAVMVGTSGAMRLFASEQADTTPPGLWRYRLDRRRALVGGALSNGGNLLAWLWETLRLPPMEEVDAALLEAEPGSHGLTVLPFLAGERAPAWTNEAMGVISGLRLHTRPLHIVHACLEAVAFSFYGIFSRLAPLAAPDADLIATGGALLRSPAWMQILCDVLGRPLHASLEPEGSSRGAALAALEALGAIGDVGELPAATGARFLPREKYHDMYREGLERREGLRRLLIPPSLVPGVETAPGAPEK